MTDQKMKLSALFSACWNDEALKARFMSDPRAVLKDTTSTSPTRSM